MNGTFLTNLHSLWDQGIISVRVKRDFQSNTTLYYQHIDDLMRNQTFFDHDYQINDWVTENMDLVCKQIYFDESNAIMNTSVNFTLGEIYYQKSIPVIEQRLAQGGRRLGILLNQIAKNRRAKPSDNPNKFCPGTIALIAVLAGELVIAIVVGIVLWFRWKARSAKVPSYSYSP